MVAVGGRPALGRRRPVRDGHVLPDHAAQQPGAPSGTPSVTGAPSPRVSPTPTAGPSPALLPDLANRFTGEADIRSDAPLSGDTLQDGAFFAILQAADAEQRTVTVDIAIFLTGEEARAYLLAEDPERLAEGLDDGYLVVNDVERPRMLTVAPTARIGTWCFSDGVVIRERTFAEWAAAPALAPTTACSEPARQAKTYWLDVRDGVVAQVTGQYLP